MTLTKSCQLFVLLLQVARTRNRVVWKLYVLEISLLTSLPTR